MSPGSRKQDKSRKKKPAEQGNSNKTRQIRSALIWSGLVLGLIVVVLGMIKITGRPQSESTRLADQNSGVSWIKGNKSAPIILIEYSDFQCPACVRYYRITKRLIEELGNEFQLHFRHYPLLITHENAVLAAQSAEAAGRQGKFWEMHDLLFEKQREWGKKKKDDAVSLFTQYAVSLNLNKQQFQDDLHSKAVTDKVYNDARTARLSGVKSTPTFFLNGQKVVNKPHNYETFKNLILETKRNLS